MGRRVGEQKRCRQPVVVIAEPQGRAGREIAAGAGAADGDAGRVDAEIVGGVAHPADRGHRVVVRDRVGHAVDGQSVVDADDHRAGPFADLPRHPVRLGHVEVAARRKAPPCSQTRQDGCVLPSEWTIDPDGHRPVRSGRVVGADVDCGRRGSVADGT